LISYPEALELILQNAKQIPEELISLSQARGRVLTERIISDRDYPPFNRSAMDGFAIRTQDYIQNHEFVYERELAAGKSISLEPKENVIRIMTGAPVPSGLDAVVKIEDSHLTEFNGVKKVKFHPAEIKPWSNIAKQGEDVSKGTFVMDAGQSIFTSEISLLASLGISQMRVAKLPIVNIISTGNELISLGEIPLPYQIRDSNSHTITSIFAKYNITPFQTSLVHDDIEILTMKIKEGLESDILVLSGGVSMGTMDLVPSILQKLDVKLIFHKTGIKPGKPIWFGKKNDTAVFGLPGNPFSVQTCARIFLEPYIRKISGQNQAPILKLPLSKSKIKKSSLTEFFPVKYDIGETTYLTPVSFNGSGDIRAGLHSDGLGIFPDNKTNLNEGEIIQFLPW